MFNEVLLGAGAPRSRKPGATLFLAAALASVVGCREEVRRLPGVDPEPAVDASNGREHPPVDEPDAGSAIDMALAPDVQASDVGPATPDAEGDAHGSVDTHPADGAIDAARPDSRGDALADAGDVGPSACGHQRPDVSMITGTDGLAIGSDGTIYFTQTNATGGWIGRWVPTAAAPEPHWFTVPMGTKLTGLAVDDDRKRLYIASVTAKAIQWLNLATTPPALKTLVAGAKTPDDVVLGPNGDVYYSDQSDKQIHRVTPAGVASLASKEPIGTVYVPAGLAFGADGALYVGTAGPGSPILRLVLAGGSEQSRASYGHYLATGNGLVFDSGGRLYMSSTTSMQGRVVRIASDNAGAVQLLAGSSFASMAFGRGALDCKDLYVASPTGPVVRFEADTPGIP